MKKRHILFLTGNCEGKALVEDRGGNLVVERIYSLNSYSDSWTCIQEDDIEKAKNKFRQIFNILEN